MTNDTATEPEEDLEFAADLDRSAAACIADGMHLRSTDDYGCCSACGSEDRVTSKVNDARYLAGISEIDDDMSDGEWREAYGPSPVERPEPSKFGATPRPFAAAHSGRCMTCEDGFSEGELIIHAPGGWAHAVCPAEKPTGAVCTSCHTAASLSGECLC
jgi:hypothetical protein